MIGHYLGIIGMALLILGSVGVLVLWLLARSAAQAPEGQE